MRSRRVLPALVLALLLVPGLAASQPPAFLTSWGSIGSGPGQLHSPGDLAIDASGRVLVADPGNGRVQVFSRSGVYLSQWTGPDSPFWFPHSIAVGGGDRPFVLETPGGRIEVYSPTGVLEET